MMTYEEAITHINRSVLLRHDRQKDTGAVRLALYSLEKQIPRKPVNKSNGKRIENCDVVVCPNCNKRLKLKSKGRYCDKCGQAIDWSEE